MKKAKFKNVETKSCLRANVLRANKEILDNRLNVLSIKPDFFLVSVYNFSIEINVGHLSP